LYPWIFWMTARLEYFRQESQDFIIANHVLEHVINVIQSVRRWYEVLKPNGILYLSVPDWRFTAIRCAVELPSPIS